MSAVARPARKRCGVFTRKSTDEGLEQAYTSTTLSAMPPCLHREPTGRARSNSLYGSWSRASNIEVWLRSTAA
jgi:hypothetical protein